MTRLSYEKNSLPVIRATIAPTIAEGHLL